MGEIIHSAIMPPLELEAVGTAPFRYVELIVDGKCHERVTPNTGHIKIRRKLALAGRHYAYFHLVQTDGQEAWSSPIWMNITSKKGHATDEEEAQLSQGSAPH
jgi:hypothetical protein